MDNRNERVHLINARLLLKVIADSEEVAIAEAEKLLHDIESCDTVKVALKKLEV